MPHHLRISRLDYAARTMRVYSVVRHFSRAKLCRRKEEREGGRDKETRRQENRKRETGRQRGRRTERQRNRQIKRQKDGGREREREREIVMISVFLANKRHRPNNVLSDETKRMNPRLAAGQGLIFGPAEVSSLYNLVYTQYRVNRCKRLYRRSDSRSLMRLGNSLGWATWAIILLSSILAPRHSRR